MKSRLWLSLCVALLWAGVAGDSFAASEDRRKDCLNMSLPAETRFVACRAAAESGDADAQFTLGLMYHQGRGVVQDYAEAAVQFRRAAKQGDAGAQSNLGAMYDKGQGVVQDYALAVSWYRRAAEQGLAVAQSNLGFMYYKGQGVLQDYTLAHMWYNLAGAGGNEKAGKNRDRVAEQMTPSQIAEAQRMAREWSEAHRAGGRGGVRTGR